MKTHIVMLLLSFVAVTGFAALDLPDERPGVPVPREVKPQEDKPPAVTVADELGIVLDLKDGSHVIGRITPRNLPLVIRSESIGEVKIVLERIREIHFAATNQAVVVTLQNGDKLQGLLAQESFKLNTAFGKVVIPTKFAARLKVTAARSGKPPEGCVLWYSFDADDGDRVTDKSGRDNHGRVRGAEYVDTGKIGGAYRFSRGERQMWTTDRPNWVIGDQPFSMALWVNLNALPHNQSGTVLIGQDEGPGGLPKWCLVFFHDVLCFHLNGPQANGDNRIARYQFKPELNRWYHLALTREGRSYRLYLDGKCVKTDENTARIPAVDAELTIGQAEGLGINGRLDEVMLFKRRLADEEIADLYESQK